MVRYAKQWSDLVWAIGGCSGIGGHVAMRLLGDGEEVVDAPARPSARMLRGGLFGDVPVELRLLDLLAVGWCPVPTQLGQ